MQSFKTNSSREVKRYLKVRSERGLAATGDGGIFSGWQKGYHDEIIRDDDQRDAALAYVRGNAVRHGLVQSIDEWPWSSVHFPGLVDRFEL